MKSCIYRKWANELQATVCEYDTCDSVVCDEEYCADCQVRQEREEEE